LERWAFLANLPPSAGDSLKRGYRSVVRQVKENPMPALLIGVGITWMILRAENDDPTQTENQTSRAADDPPVSGSPRTGETEPLMPHEQPEKSGIASVVKEKAGQAQEALSGATEAVTGKISDIGSGRPSYGQISRERSE
jgi:hypothetical protein